MCFFYLLMERAYYKEEALFNYNEVIESGGKFFLGDIIPEAWYERWFSKPKKGKGKIFILNKGRCGNGGIQVLSTTLERTVRDCLLVSLIEISCFQKNLKAKTFAVCMVEQRTLIRRGISESVLGIRQSRLKDLLIVVWRLLILISSLSQIHQVESGLVHCW